MRKINAILSMGIIILFLFHAIAGAFQLMGVYQGGNKVMQVLAWVMTVMIGLHTIIGIKLTADSIKAIKRSGGGYFKENKLFWARRISGLAIMVFILLHIVIFMGVNDGAYRLSFFGPAQLASQILLVLSIALHVITNAKPVLISFGFKGFKELGLDIALVLSFILIFTGIAFIIYYFRWIKV